MCSQPKTHRLASPRLAEHLRKCKSGKQRGAAAPALRARARVAPEGNHIEETVTRLVKLRRTYARLPLTKTTSQGSSSTPLPRAEGWGPRTRGPCTRAVVFRKPRRAGAAGVATHPRATQGRCAVCTGPQ